MSIDEVPSEMPPRHPHDFSSLQGLQIVGAAENHASDDWREALKLELETRAARFHQAVDASMVLSDDGVIRWLGDPVARLAAGPDLLSPRALVLADTSLPESARDIVAARLELWLAATVRRLLGPLLALRSLQEESEPVRQLGAKIADLLGVLEREPLKSQIKALDQNSRAALRRHGVRFGAYYIYIPQSLKPVSRALALQLWSVRMPDLSGEEFVKTLLPLASTGRTSLPVNPSISKEGYRVAGFRTCGERAVRVDIVERLSDIIRGSFVACSISDATRASGSAFVISGQMTSLTGCSGDAFASILRSLGYESFEIEPSRLGDPRIAGEAAAVGTASAETGVVAAKSGGEQPISEEVLDVGADDTASEENGAVVQPAKPDEADRANDPPDVSPEPVECAGQAEPAASETMADEASSSVQTTVIAWRLARRQRPERPKRRHRHGEAATKASFTDEGVGSESRANFLRRGKAEIRAGAKERQPERSSADSKREPFKGKKRGSSAAKPDAPPAVAQIESRRPTRVDPTSPFAKLLELRTVLEKQGKNR